MSPCDIDRLAAETAFQAHQSGQLDEAEQGYRAILARNPDYFDALQLLGVLNMHRGDYASAGTWLTRAVAVNPEDTGAWLNLAIVEQELRHSEAAIAIYDRILRRAPGHSAALNGRGVVLNWLQRFDEARASLDDAVAADPGNAEALFNRGTTLYQLHLLELALADFEAALRLDPGNPDALLNRGQVLLTMKRYDEADEALTHALQINPRAIDLQGSRAQARWMVCNWTDYDALRDAVIGDVRAGFRACAPFQFFSATDCAADQLSAARLHAAGGALATLPSIAEPCRAPADRIRVAYVSPDFREHALSYLMAGLIEQHDRTQFEIIGVSLGADLPDDAMQKRMKSAFDAWIALGKVSDADAVERLRARQFDIAVDCAGPTVGARPNLFRARIAPLQVSYLGFPGTTGSAWIDYLVADAYVIPVQTQRFYSEKIIRLPECFQCNDDRRAMATTRTSRAQHGLPTDALVFCSFHASYKINPTMFDIWMRLLDRVPHSVLWVLADQPQTQTNLQAAAAARGIDPGRLVFAQVIPYPEHLQRLTLADLSLDTLPFNGGTTTSDALWAGVPLVTVSGEAFAARMSGSLLKAVGLEQLIAPDLVAYEQLAYLLAQDEQRLRSLQQHLIDRRAEHSLFDTRRFARHLELAWVQIARAKQTPSDLTIDAMPRPAAAAKRPAAASIERSWWRRLGASLKRP